jgi:hypothetical protein
MRNIKFHVLFWFAKCYELPFMDRQAVQALFDRFVIVTLPFIEGEGMGIITTMFAKIVALALLFVTSASSAAVVNNGFDLKQSLQKTSASIIPNTWHYFNFLAAGNRVTFNFTVTGLYGELILTDLYCSGDTFMLLVDQDEVAGPSPKIAPTCEHTGSDPEVVATQDKHSKLNHIFLPGVHTVTVVVIDSPYESGRAAIKITNYER